jgi:hypothetical protein
VSNLSDQAQLLYLASEQRLWGTLIAVSVGLAVVFDGRAQQRAKWFALAASVIFGFFLLLSRLAGRRRLARRR